MRLEKHISDLLYEHDCVVVPGFGAFVVNYTPASLNKLNFTFKPPFGKLSFNRNIKHNDGLLAHTIAKEKNLSYAEALSVIQAEVNKWQNLIGNKEKVNLPAIGTLFTDKLNKLQFQQDDTVNYLTESFGLSSFQAIPKVKKEEKKEKVKPLPENRKAVSPAENHKKKVWWPYAVALPLLAVAIWVPIQKHYFQKINYSGILPWVERTPEFYKERKSDIKLNTIVSAKEIHEINAGHVNIDGKKIAVYTRRLDKDNTRVVKTNTAENTDGHYHVIGGCFSSLKNARRLVKKLKKLGFNANIIGKHKDLYTVAYASYSSRGEAVKGLELAQSDNPKAWILKK